MSDVAPPSKELFRVVDGPPACIPEYARGVSTMHSSCARTLYYVEDEQNLIQLGSMSEELADFVMKAIRSYIAFGGKPPKARFGNTLQMVIRG
jgi:hypothetical protein